MFTATSGSRPGIEFGLSVGSCDITGKGDYRIAFPIPESTQPRQPNQLPRLCDTTPANILVKGMICALFGMARRARTSPVFNAS
jgi:hypothetical protein